MGGAGEVQVQVRATEGELEGIDDDGIEAQPEAHLPICEALGVCGVHSYVRGPVSTELLPLKRLKVSKSYISYPFNFSLLLRCLGLFVLLRFLGWLIL